MNSRRIFTFIIRIIITIIIAILAYTLYATVNGMYLNAKKGAARDAASNYASAIEYELVIKQLNGEKLPYIYFSTALNTKGTKPDKVSVILVDGRVDRGEMVFGDYTVTFRNGVVIDVKKD